MVFLQTSCSKEQSENSGIAPRKTAPVALSQQHSDVLDFIDQYEFYANEEAYEYPSLSIEDAEWIIEATFNYEHQLVDLSLDKYGILHDSTIFFPLTTGSEEGSPIVANTALFDAYHSILNISTGSNIAPMSDVEIITDETGDFIVNFSIARIYDLTPNLVDIETRKTYSSNYFSFECLPGIKSTPHWCGGGQPTVCAATSDNSWEILKHNLRVDYANPNLVTTGNSGYYYSIKHKIYGSDPFDINSYLGPLSQDYSLSLYGTHPTVNPNTIANGYYNQCLTNTQVQDYESEMVQIINDNTLLNSREVWDLNVKAHDEFNSHGGTLWTHHIFEFSTGILRTP